MCEIMLHFHQLSEMCTFCHTHKVTVMIFPTLFTACCMSHLRSVIVAPVSSLMSNHVFGREHTCIHATLVHDLLIAYANFISSVGVRNICAKLFLDHRCFSNSDVFWQSGKPQNVQ